MTQISGVVQSLQSKQVPNKKRPGQMYTFWTAYINGTPVNVGFNSGPVKGVPLFSQGMEVTIETEAGYKDELKYIEGTLKTGLSGGSSGGGNAPVRASSPAASGVVAGDRELSIIRQSALKAAVDTVNAVGSKGTLAERLKDIVSTAYHYVKFSSGQLELDTIKELTAAKKNKANADPVVDEVEGNAG